ncbi:DUF805 domain-containing protein [Burkholderia sp. FERM BP-3421]|jgi:uncharacterized membrane protein YhaH (DUF805 family)|uniref:DUF805 domain-containing protein n=1 Tax=Burkholderia sp. FERM BP-3421 TaxID=1494466 RepID=UPI00235E5068|nr:DUF805 domain-containing protein [Burkholderia sp. FERM BP-3421]WDD93067.1 DUF805 domain-containing protein [Burkholderia sp. FERM BP-3421]
MSALSLAFAFFKRRGRITRSTWLSRLVVAGLFCAAFGEWAGRFAGEAGAGVFALLFIWAALALSIQRLHDIGRSGAALWVALVPVLGPLWVVVQLLKRGAAHENRFGPDPASRDDYLQVPISR